MVIFVMRTPICAELLRLPWTWFTLHLCSSAIKTEIASTPHIIRSTLPVTASLFYSAGVVYYMPDQSQSNLYLPISPNCSGIYQQ